MRKTAATCHTPELLNRGKLKTRELETVAAGANAFDEWRTKTPDGSTTAASINPTPAPEPVAVKLAVTVAGPAEVLIEFGERLNAVSLGGVAL